MLFLLILLNLCNSYWGFRVNFSRQLPSHLHAVKDLVVSSPTSSPQAEPNHPPKREINIPTVGLGKDQYDVFSRLLKDRILILGSDVNDEVANVMVSQMLYLAAEDPFRDITLYINSPGGSVQAGLAIFDTMQYIPCDVSTVCFGAASSMGAFLLAAGTKGKRKSLPSSRIMIHQPLGGSQGEASELQIAAKLLVHTKECLNAYLADFCNQPVDKIAVDTDRDFYMSPEEAKEYGIIDEVIQHKRTVRKPKVPDLMIQPPLPFHDRNYLAEIKKSAREPLQADPWRFRESK